MSLFLLALGLRWGFLFLNGAALMPDSWGRYLPVSRDLFSHWSGSVFDTPAYPAFIALCHGLWDAWPSPLLLQGLLDALSVLLIHRLALQLGFRRGAFYLGLFFCCHGGGIFFANALLSESLFTFLITLCAYGFSRLNKNSGWRSLMLPGFCLALATLTRANGQLIALVFTIVILFCRFRQGNLKPLICLLLCTAVPVTAWILYNRQVHGVSAVAQGGGWQWLQNMAYFELIDPETLPAQEADRYRDWTSLSAFRQRLLEDPSLPAHRLEARFRDIARQNALNRPLDYLAAMPRVFLLPRRFIKDVTKRACDPKLWQAQNTLAARQGYAQYGRPLSRLTQTVFPLLRALTVFPYKYSLLILALFPAFFLALRRRDSLGFLLSAIPLSQWFILTLMLNPIERYYYPFETLMVLSLMITLRHFRAQTKTVPSGETAS